MITEKNGKLIVATPYNKAFAEGMKQLHGRWNPEDKNWIVATEKRAEVEALIDQAFQKGEESISQTLKERVDEIVSNPENLHSGDCYSRLVSFAFHYGRESACRETSDLYTSLLKAQRKRASVSRYSNYIIQNVLSAQTYIPMKDYPGRITNEIGNLKTKL